MDTPLKHILIVEDERPYLHALMLKLRKAGYEVDGVNNGEDGMSLLREKTFDLLLLDLVMPDTNGFTILDDLKKRQVTLPIIVLSNLSQEEDKARVKSYGVLEFFEKTDTTIAEIVQKVTQQINS